MEYNPCKENGTCVFDHSQGSSVCKCRKGLHGHLCQKGGNAVYEGSKMQWGCECVQDDVRANLGNI